MLSLALSIKIKKLKYLYCDYIAEAKKTSSMQNSFIIKKILDKGDTEIGLNTFFNRPSVAGAVL